MRWLLPERSRLGCAVGTVEGRTLLVPSRARHLEGGPHVARHILTAVSTFKGLVVCQSYPKFFACVLAHLTLERFSFSPGAVSSLEGHPDVSPLSQQTKGKPSRSPFSLWLLCSTWLRVPQSCPRS